jgi:hypothetical protein
MHGRCISKITPNDCYDHNAQWFSAASSLALCRFFWLVTRHCAVFETETVLLNLTQRVLLT